MAISIRLPPDIEARLNALAAATGRSKTFYVTEAIQVQLDDLEDVYLGERTLERVRRGQEEVISGEEFWRGLAD